MCRRFNFFDAQLAVALTEISGLSYNLVLEVINDKGLFVMFSCVESQSGLSSMLSFLMCVHPLVISVLVDGLLGMFGRSRFSFYMYDWATDPLNLLDELLHWDLHSTRCVDTEQKSSVSGLFLIKSHNRVTSCSLWSGFWLDLRSFVLSHTSDCVWRVWQLDSVKHIWWFKFDSTFNR